MIIEDKIEVKNFKCFKDEGNGFDRIMPLNIIIGKNNSGKSSLIDLIHYIVTNHRDSMEDKTIHSSEVIVHHKLSEQEVSFIFNLDPEKDENSYTIALQNNRKYIGKLYSYQLTRGAEKKFKNALEEFTPENKGIMERQFTNGIQTPFNNKFHFCNIAADRDIISEEVYKNIHNVAVAASFFKSNGQGATNLIRYIINNSNQNLRLVKNNLLDNLNLIVKPDIEFKEILVRHNDNDIWEVFFVDINDNLIALSKMGSGVKTILLVLLNLIVRPKAEEKDEDKYVFAFEELENNLHPSLQRRLYNYIIDYSKENSCYFFITTHSNIVIDIFGANEDAQIIHVTNNGEKSTTTTVSKKEIKHIIQDLGMKASDLLQSNGVIWVEGPSDRNYLNKWIKELDCDLQEGSHYSIMFYGGRLLSNLSFDYDWFNREVIPMLKINRNAYVIIDRDGKSEASKINDTKQRINKEIGDNCWITEGREIENYLHETTIQNWLLDKYKIDTNFKNHKNRKLESNIASSYITKTDSKKMAPYNKNKKSYSFEIGEYININSMDKLDLMERLKDLIKVIKGWNE